jgi:hypothetical protein
MITLPGETEPLGYTNGKFSLATAVGELIGLVLQYAPHIVCGYVIGHFIVRYW